MNRVLGIAALALVLTGLNALKPLTLDDFLFLEFAQHLARHPFDPYGGMSLGSGMPGTQFAMPAPGLVLPYWWALGIALFGDHELAWKLWLFPIAFLLVWAVDRLAERFAPGAEALAAVIVVGSPTVLAGFNFMLDVPALALALAALVLVLAAADRGSLRAAVGAGILAGLAVQTKYSALPVAAVIFFAAALARRPFLGVLAVGSCAAVVLGWDAWVWSVRGTSHLWHHVMGRAGAGVGMRSGHELYILFGEIAPALLVLGAAAFGARRVHIVALIVMLAAIYVLQAAGLRALTLPGATGIALWILLALALCRLWWETAGADDRRMGWFLFGWLLLEIVGSYVIAPFPAARRLITILVVATLILARLYARSCDRHAHSRWAANAAAVVAVVFGLAIQSLDIAYHLRWRDAAALAAAWPDASGARRWFWGNGTFHHYARTEGMTFAEPGTSRLAPGDLFFDVNAPRFPPPLSDPGAAELVAEVTVGSPLVLEPGLQGGHRLLQPEPSPVRLRIYRVRTETTAQSPPPRAAAVR